ncbi:MAG: hydantoinase/oxoprolinase family protein [Roseomonas sp.]|nr:hydantoinase/oxoprolinase family protein [Roseomonas sp.]
MNTAPWRIGVDIGGTFTDLVMLDSRDGRIFNGKVLTTPHAPEEAVLEGVRDLLSRTGARADQVRHVIHGTTLVANALIERRGVPTGLITTKGFRDILEIGTELRHDTYDLFMRVPEPLVPRHRRLGVAERLLPDGTVREAVDEAGAREAVRALRAAGAKAVAVCFLHAFRNPAHEARMREILSEEAPDLTICLSSEVVPEIGEYERASTTVCNAYVQPVFERYLRRLSDGLRGFGLIGPLFLMLSDGGTVAEETAARHPIRLVQSGPAGGVEATGIYGAAAGARDILCFDMGGTTAKAALIDNGEAQRSLDFEVARVDRFRKGSGLPLKVPVIDMIEIGAGGGSIARVDRLGLVRVGPESASSDPGPACYGLGGARPTVTDADLVLGYLGAESFLGGAMKLDVAAAEAALAEHIGKPLGLSVPEAAWAIHETVNGNMAQAAAIHALEKAKRIDAYAMVPIGGAGPVHACHIGMKLGLRRIIVPLGAGVASAFGFLAAPISFAFVQGWVAPLAGLDFAKLREITGTMTAQGKAMAAAAGGAPEAASARILGAMRYAGQGFQVEAEIPAESITHGDAAMLRAKFEAAYLALYGRTEPSLPVECVSWQVIVAGPRPVVDLTQQGTAAEGTLQRGTRRAWFRGAYVETPVLNRLALRPGESVQGPALIEERECTLVLPPGATARCDAALNLDVSLPA